jgi:hypothetical protein
MSIEALSRV